MGKTLTSQRVRATMTFRSNHRYKATRAGIKCVHVSKLVNIQPPSGWMPSTLRVYASLYKRLYRTIERFRNWQLKGLHS